MTTGAHLKQRKEKKFKPAMILAVILQMIVSLAVCVLLIYYGPFVNVRKYIVGTAMSSKSHQYLATLFLSQEQISKLINPNIADVSQDTSSVKISESKSNDILQYTVDGNGQFNGFVLIIKDPTRVKVGLTSKLGEQGETTSEIAQENDAAAAINAGGFLDRASSGKIWSGTGAYPTYFVIHNGQVEFSAVANDYALSDGNDQNASVVAFDENGTLIVGKHSINDLLAMNVKESVVFGPTLVVNGKATFSGDGGQGMTARTAIGQLANGDVIMVVADGRRLNLPGATLGDMRDILLRYGAVTAVNLDGGSSATMFYNGKVINNPCDPLGERSIPTVWYVAGQGGE